jgi:crotonobetainyl-CoA:carnitine CoA-transferase CaiB-like acyl-CoA transferase
MVQPNNVFTDFKVLDVASFIGGPAAATIRSDFGADVIKIEPPGSGDPYCAAYATPPYPVAETKYGWQLTNRNKRSIALRKSEQAKKMFWRLVK